jgi:hypothetical protein
VTRLKGESCDDKSATGAPLELFSLDDFVNDTAGGLPVVIVGNFARRENPKKTADGISDSGST